jgi:protein-arginine deiminase
VSKIDDTFENHQFVEEIQRVVGSVRVLKDPHISNYHRWLQDIIKFGSVMDGQKRSQTVLFRGPHFDFYGQGPKASYIYRFFNYPSYDFHFDRDFNHDDFGNIQVIPIKTREYPFGRVIYGTAPKISAIEMSYVLRNFLESQQVQRPIRVPTDWLHVGHVDEILSYVPDSSSPIGTRIMIASPRAFFRLLSTLPPATQIFNNPKTFHMFTVTKDTPEIKRRYRQRQTKIHDQTPGACIYDPQITVEKLLNWTDLRTTNNQYQTYLDRISSDLKTELQTDHISSSCVEIPVCYWPKSVIKNAKAMFPNMINSLYLPPDKILVPKPCVIQGQSTDPFERDYQSKLPPGVTAHFLHNWDSYHIIDGDINCGTNTERQPDPHPWWLTRPLGETDI